MRPKRQIVALIVCATAIACGRAPATPAPLGSAAPGAPQASPSTPQPSSAAVASPAEPAPTVALAPWTYPTGDIRALGFAADGTAYVFSWRGDAPSQLIALDAGGAVKAGWPVDVGQTGVEGRPTEAPDGDIVILAFSYDNDATITYEVDRFGPDGTVRHGWPYRFTKGDDCGGPRIDRAGNVIVACGSDQASHAVAIAPSGDVAWDTSLGMRGGSRVELGSDGTVYVGSARGDGLAALSASGIPLDSWPVELADGGDFQPLASGGVLTWWHEGAEEDICHGGGRTFYAILGADGVALADWPQSLSGYGSAPAIGADGSIYAIDGGGQAVAFAPDGSARVGWPAQVAGTTSSCFGPPTPSVAADGTLFVATGGAAPDGALSAIGPDGRLLDGWPLAPNVEFAYPCRGCTPGPPEPDPVLTAGDRTYVAMYSGDFNEGTDIVALDRDGAVVSGWPAHVEASEVGLAMSPDGRLFAILRNPDDGSASTLAFLAASH